MVCLCHNESHTIRDRHWKQVDIDKKPVQMFSWQGNPRKQLKDTTYDTTIGKHNLKKLLWSPRTKKDWGTFIKQHTHRRDYYVPQICEQYDEIYSLEIWALMAALAWAVVWYIISFRIAC